MTNLMRYPRNKDRYQWKKALQPLPVKCPAGGNQRKRWERLRTKDSQQPSSTCLKVATEGKGIIKKNKDTRHKEKPLEAWQHGLPSESQYNSTLAYPFQSGFLTLATSAPTTASPRKGGFYWICINLGSEINIPITWLDRKLPYIEDNPSALFRIHSFLFSVAEEVANIRFFSQPAVVYVWHNNNLNKSTRELLSLLMLATWLYLSAPLLDKVASCFEGKLYSFWKGAYSGRRLTGP